MDVEDKLIAKSLKIPILEEESGFVLFKSNTGSETVFYDKKHSVVGTVFKVIEMDKNAELKHLVFIDNVLNLISLIRSKKLNVVPNIVFIILNNPVNQLFDIIKKKYKFIYKYSLSYPKTTIGQILSIKTILFISGCKKVNVSFADNSFNVIYDNENKNINVNTAYQHLIRNFNIHKYNISFIPFGYNVFNLKLLYGYKD